MKHREKLWTPGPWTRKHPGSTCRIVHLRSYYSTMEFEPVVAVYGPPIDLENGEKLGVLQEAEAVANVNLIRTGPELVDALEALLEQTEGIKDECIEAANRKALAALDKVYGGDE